MASHRFISAGQWLAIICLIATVAGVRFLLQSKTENARDETLPQARSDYSVNDLDLSIIGEDGLVQFEISAPYLEQIPQTEDLTLQQPDVIMYEQGQPIWHLSAQAGRIARNGSAVELAQNVELIEQGSVRPRSFYANHMLLDPDLKTAQTPSPVRMEQTGLKVAGIGLQADLTSQHYEILKQVQAVYAP